MNRKLVFTIILFIILALVLYFLRPWFHSTAMFFYTNPVILQAIVVTLLIHFLVLKRIPALKKSVEFSDVEGGSSETIHISTLSILTPLILIFLLIVGSIFAGWFRNIHITEQVEYVSRQDLPESSNNLRLMPYSVARRYAKDSLQLSQFKLGTENIALIDENMSWTFPLTPDGTVIQFTKKNKGITYIDATEQDRNTKNFFKDMEIGEGMYITDNLFWNIFKHRYFVDVDDPYYLIDEKNEDILTALGATSYDFNFRYGVAYTVPKFEGVFLTDTSGDLELLSPEEAQEHSVLGENRVFPENLAREYTNAYQYHLGVLNKLFIHEDQIKIQDVRDFAEGSRVNRQPYLMDTEEGLKWFISAEPHGDSHGIFKIFVIDALSGDFEIFELEGDDILTGPAKAVDYVRRSNPIVDWNRFDSVEPLPFVREQNLFWKLTVIPSDSAGIAYQAFVDASTNEVYELSEEDEIKKFLDGDIDLEEIDPTTDPTSDEVLNEIRKKFTELEELFEQIDL